MLEGFTAVQFGAITVIGHSGSETSYSEDSKKIFNLSHTAPMMRVHPEGFDGDPGVRPQVFLRAQYQAEVHNEGKSWMIEGITYGTDRVPFSQSSS